jgi:arginine decarboxylase
MRRRKLIVKMGAGLAGAAAVTGFVPGASGADRSPSGGAVPERGRGPLVPTRMFLTTSTSTHERRARADDLLLWRAGIGNCNRVEVSSIVPPGCKLIPRQEGVKLLQDGQIVFAVLGKSYSCTPGERIITAIGMAIPEDGGTGCVSEAEGVDPDADPAYVTRRAVEAALGMMAMRLGSDFDPHKEYVPNKAVYQIGRTPVRVHTAAESATVDGSGRPTFVLTSLVFLM